MEIRIRTEEGILKSVLKINEQKISMYEKENGKVYESDHPHD